MADRIKIKFKNIKKAKSFFRSLGVASLRAVGAAALAGITPIFKDMVRRVPERTGKLKGALVIDIRKRKGQATAFAGPTKEGAHAVFLEFGTVNMSAQPFMRPAMEAKHVEATNKTFSVYEKFIKLIARRGI